MNKETNKWEEEFNKEFLRFFQSKGAGSEYVGIKQFIKNLLKEQEAPMGVSQWRELGKKYGYDKYFEEKMIEKIENTPIEMAHTYGSENAGEYRAFDAGQEDYKQRILNKFK